MKIVTKRIYEEPAPADGRRVLVDRLWPRGLSKERAAIELWARDVAPSNELRRWYGHEPARWNEFRRRYSAELDARPEAVGELRDYLDRVGDDETVTLLFSSKEERLNNATALADYLSGRRLTAPRG